jgi:Transglutaminase-like superfamily
MSAFAMTAIFQLAPDVSFCRADDRLVFLHLKRERYFQLTEKQAEWFEALQAASDQAVLAPAVARFAAQLESMGFLSFLPGNTFPLLEHRSPAASRSAIDYPLKTRPRHAPVLLPAIVGSVLTVGLRLKWTGLGATLRALERKKQAAGVSPTPTDNRVLLLATEFQGWSPFLFTSHDACLFRSLALADFLCAECVPALFVIAVRCQPFRAHAWVQHDSVILNEHLEVARNYSPIFSV